MGKRIYSNPIGITSQFFFCGLPFRLDTYAGCSFQCRYCFARYRGGNTFGEDVRPANPNYIESLFDRAFSDKSGGNSFISQFLRRRVPIHFGGMSDPFLPAEKKYGVSKKVLQVLSKYDYPTVLSTKGTLVTEQSYLKILKDMKYLIVQFSFSTAVDKKSKQIEPFSSTPSQLLKATELLASNGINVTSRWQPYIPGFSEHPNKFISRVASAGSKHVGLEHLKVPIERSNQLWKRFINATDTDFYKEYKNNGAILNGREYILPSQNKLEIIKSTKEACLKQGINFGAADNEFQYLSTSDCCCSGVDIFPGFENWFKHQFGYAVRKGMGRRIEYDLIKNEWTPSGSIRRYLNSHSRMNTKIQTLKDHIRMRWNDPTSKMTPASLFYSVKASKDLSSNQDIIYDWE